MGGVSSAGHTWRAAGSLWGAGPAAGAAGGGGGPRATLGAGLGVTVLASRLVGDWQSCWSSALTSGPPAAAHFLPCRATWGGVVHSVWTPQGLGKAQLHGC